MSTERPLPTDFGARLRAARAYKDNSREQFAALLNTPSVSESNLKAYERGARQPQPLAAESLIKRLAAVSGLPEAFFWGEDPAEPEPDIQLERIDQKLDALSTEVAANVLAITQQLEVVQQQLQAARRRRPA